MANVFIAIFVASIAVSVIQQFFDHSRSSQRRIYWSCACVAAVAGFLAVYPDSKKGLWMALFALGAMMLIAYAYTPYIKIRGKIYALSVQDSDPDRDEASAEATADVQHDPAPDAYSGLLTAAKMWWILIPLMLISSVNTYAFAIGEGEWWVAAIGIAFLIFLAIATGYGDASWGYPVARGQLVQFIILAVVTVGAFTVLYLGAYAAGRRRPRRSKHSMEYRAHPELRKKFSE